MAYGPDGRRIASTNQKGLLRVLDLNEASARERYVISSEPREGARRDNPINSVAFSPDGRRLAFGDSLGIITVCDAESGRVVRRLSKGPVNRSKEGQFQDNPLRFSPDGRHIAAAIGSMVMIWDALTGQEVLTLRGHRGSITAMAYSPDGRRLVTSAFPEAESTVKVWDLYNGAVVMNLRHFGGGSNGVLDVAYSPDGPPHCLDRTGWESQTLGCGQGSRGSDLPCRF